MNLKTTPILFGLLIAMLWGFGLMLAYKRTAVDVAYVTPSLQGADVKVESVQIAYQGDGKDKKEDVLFVNENDAWYLQQRGQKTKVEGFRVDSIVREIKDAKKYEEFRPSDDLAGYGLAPPRLTVTLKAKVKDRDREVRFFVGKDSPDKLLAYVNSSDYPNKAYAVVRSKIDSVFFKDPNYLRSKRLFDFVESSVGLVDVTAGKDELELKKNEEGIWKFEKPALGFAGFDAGGPDAADKDKKETKGGPPENVKALIAAVAGLRVDEDDDFVALGEPLERYGLDDGKESLRVVVGTGGEKKEVTNKEVLLVGKKVGQRDQYYARLLSDQGVFQLSAKSLDPIRKAVADPGKIRSNDVAAFDTKNVDAVVLAQGKQTIKLLHPDGQAWKVYADGDKARNGDEKAVQNLLEAVQGKKAILSFFDGKDDDWGGLKTPVAEVSVYVNGIEKEKKDAGKDDRDKKAEKKDDAPALKKDAKPVVKLEIGKTDGEVVHVRRTLQDGTVSRFTMPKAQVAKFELDQGALAYVERLLPPVNSLDVAAVELKRGKETLELFRRADSKASSWSLKDPKEPTGGKPADPAKVMNIITNVAGLAPKKWVTRTDAAKADLEKYGLKDPAVTVTLYVKKEGEVPSAGVAGLLGLLGATTPPGPLPAAATMAANRAADKGQAVTVQFGGDADKGGVYATRTGLDYVFVAPADAPKLLREIDVRDRSIVVTLQPMIDATAVAAAAPLVAATPVVTGDVQSFDPQKAKEVKLAVRTPFELRTFAFQRAGTDKEKTWQESSGLQEFQLDPEKVTQLVKELAKLRAERFVGFTGPREEQKLSAKEASLRAEVTLHDGRTMTLTVGAPFEKAGYFAQTTAWPDAVFLLPAATVEPWLRGVSYFSKERVAVQ